MGKEILPRQSLQMMHNELLHPVILALATRASCYLFMTDTTEMNQSQAAKSKKTYGQTRLPFLLGLLIALIASACIFYSAGPRIIHPLLFFFSVLFTSFLVAVIPVFAVIAARAIGLISGRRLAYCSMVLFLSIVTPALGLGGDLVMGYAAFVLSYVGTFMIGTSDMDCG